MEVLIIFHFNGKSKATVAFVALVLDVVVGNADKLILNSSARHKSFKCSLKL